jgi:hypothetical protein
VIDTDVRRVEWLLVARRPREAIALIGQCRTAMKHGDPVAVLPTTLLRLEGDARAALGDDAGALDAWKEAAARAEDEGIALERLRALQRLDVHADSDVAFGDEIHSLAHLLDLASLPPLP